MLRAGASGSGCEHDEEARAHQVRARRLLAGDRRELPLDPADGAAGALQRMRAARRGLTAERDRSADDEHRQRVERRRDAGKRRAERRPCGGNEAEGDDRGGDDDPHVPNLTAAGAPVSVSRCECPRE